MQIMLVVAAAVLGYVLGSFPSGYLVSKLWGVDILRHHSGRTGGTNVFRVLGLLPALLTGALDVGKGALAVWVAGQISGLPVAEVLAGAAAILGHNYSFAIRFRGGAGVGTSLGALGAIYWPAGLGLIILLVLVIVATRYASVGSLTVLTAMPFLLLALHLIGILVSVYILYGILAWIIIVNAHRPNIQRLRQGTERRLSFTKATPVPRA
ncbi:MAG: glycerol-3-phosphate acyltransferase [Anaerolineae bacterium]|nr:glycerol-3-phosphate acyltransferase [Anaerolineae bacterium]